MTTIEEYLITRNEYRRVEKRFAAELAPYKLTPMDVVALSRCTGKTKAELAKALHVTLPLVTNATNKLEKKGLISVETRKEDRRFKHMSVTLKGHQILQKIRA